jgi:hypothetical protein
MSVTPDALASLATIHGLDANELLEIAAYWNVDPAREPHLLTTVVQAAAAPLVSPDNSRKQSIAKPHHTNCIAGSQPANWEEYEDPNSGHPYWYNVVTQTCTWDHPEEIRYRWACAAFLATHSYLCSYIVCV